MSPNPIEITIEQPFDVVGAIIVPVMAILVSSGIAVWLAHRERVAAESARAREAIAGLSREFTALSIAFKNQNGAEVNRIQARITAETNALAVLLPKKHGDVPKYVAVVFYRFTKMQQFTPKSVTSVCTFLVTALESWATGALKTSDFTKAMPHDISPGEWVATVDLADWMTRILPEAPPPPPRPTSATDLGAQTSE